MQKTHQKSKLFIVLSMLITLLVSSCKYSERTNESLSVNLSYIDAENELILNDKKESFDYGENLSKEELYLEKSLIALRDLFEKNIKITS